ncbi:hypothetical protein [Specibacter cremeus]|uniref:hypothetical protein n=1 Tax=Specibacter cremeus TaxID=1629051 RepID=UPI000F79C41C|nr:hypothetical protein [Specibacter cremeus]
MNANDVCVGTMFTVIGGVGSTRYQLGVIALAGSRIDAISADLDPVGPRADFEATWLEEGTMGLPDHPYAAVERMREAAKACSTARIGLKTLADNTATAARRYDEAEERNRLFLARKNQLDAFRAGSHFTAQSWLLPGGPNNSVRDLGRWLDSFWTKGFRDATEDSINGGPAFLAGAAGGWPALAYLLSLGRHPERSDTAAAAAAGVRHMLDSTGVTRPGTVSVRRIPAGDWSAQPSGTGVRGTTRATIEGILEAPRDAYAVAPSAVIVDRIERADGTIAWRVALPGTEVWDPPDSENLFDLEGDLQALTSARRKEFMEKQVMVEELLKAALQDAGAKPGDPVMLTGHSGGGIHAAAAAADPAFLAEFNVTMVVTAGAPIARLPVDGRVGVLGLENTYDIVTAADGAAPPDRSNWVTVTSSRPGDGVGTMQDVIARAHSLDGYLGDARQAEHSADPSIDGARKSIRDFMGVAGPGQAVAFTRSVYQGRDVRPAKAPPAPATGRERRDAVPRGR